MMPQNAHGAISVKSIIVPLYTQFFPTIEALIRRKKRIT